MHNLFLSFFLLFRLLLTMSFLSHALRVSPIFIGMSIHTQSSIHFHPRLTLGLIVVSYLKQHCMLLWRTLLGLLYSHVSFKTYALRYYKGFKLYSYLGISLLGTHNSSKNLFFLLCIYTPSPS